MPFVTLSASDPYVFRVEDCGGWTVADVQRLVEAELATVVKRATRKVAGQSSQLENSTLTEGRTLAGATVSAGKRGSAVLQSGYGLPSAAATSAADEASYGDRGQSDALAPPITV